MGDVARCCLPKTYRTTKGIANFEICSASFARKPWLSIISLNIWSLRMQKSNQTSIQLVQALLRSLNMNTKLKINCKFGPNYKMKKDEFSLNLESNTKNCCTVGSTTTATKNKRMNFTMWPTSKRTE